MKLVKTRYDEESGLDIIEDVILDDKDDFKSVKECNYCKKDIDIDLEEHYVCQDNFLQAKYFDTEDENIFCCKECFCNYVQLEQIDPLDEEIIDET